MYIASYKLRTYFSNHHSVCIRLCTFSYVVCNTIFDRRNLLVKKIFLPSSLISPYFANQADQMSIRCLVLAVAALWTAVRVILDGRWVCYFRFAASVFLDFELTSWNTKWIIPKMCHINFSRKFRLSCLPPKRKMGYPSCIFRFVIDLTGVVSSLCLWYKSFF